MRQKALLKRVLIFVLILTMLIGITACGTGKTDKETNDIKQTESGTESDTMKQAGAEESREEILAGMASMLLENTPQPSYGSVGGEWLAFGLSRWGGEVPQEWYDSYYEAVESYVKECEGVLDDRKYTEYSRVIIALTAIGKDPMDVGGYNLLTPLADYEQTIFQGLNGPVYALLALDMGNYEIPENVTENTQATRELYVDYILSNELEEGGWSLAGGAPEGDITAMVLQALARYQERQDVADATERALQVLSELQNENGGYTAYDVESSESIAQVIVALTELGISTEDPRFVKNGRTLEDRLLDFMAEDYGFKHILDGESDMIATEQAFYALVSLELTENGMSSLYRLRPIV